MPAKSKAQERLMQGIKHGTIKKPGVSKADARKVLGEHGKKDKK